MSLSNRAEDARPAGSCRLAAPSSVISVTRSSCAFGAAIVSEKMQNYQQNTKVTESGSWGIRFRGVRFRGLDGAAGRREREAPPGRARAARGIRTSFL